jgi:hypothetical protein
MVMMPPRPEVEVQPWAVVVPVIPVPWAVPMAAMPVAPVPHLLNVSTLAGYRLEVSSAMPGAGAACAGTARNPSARTAKAVTSELAHFILLILLLRGGAKPCVGKCCRRELLPGMVNDQNARSS